MYKIFLVFITIFLLSSCLEFEDLEFNGMNDPKFEKIENKIISLTLGIKVHNPNRFSIKIKPSQLDVFVEEELMGKAFLDEKVKLIKKKEDLYEIPLRIELEDGVLLKLVRLSLKSKIKIRISGKVKCSIYGVSKKIEINETKEIDGKKLKLSSL